MATNETIEQVGTDFFSQLTEGVNGVDYRGRQVKFVLDHTTRSIVVERNSGRNGIYPVHSFIEAIAVAAGINPDFEEAYAIGDVVKSLCRPAEVQA